MFIYACKGFEYPIETYTLSFFIIILNVCLSRWLTPFILERRKTLSKYSEKKEDNDKKSTFGCNASTLICTPCTTPTTTTYDYEYQLEKYLNVNLSHELWKDIKIEALQIQRDNPPTWLYLFRLLWRWQVFNGIVFVMVLYPLSLLFYPYGLSAV